LIRFLAGEKGHGKTKRLIELANERVKTTEGNLVFIEHGNSHMYDLHYSVRHVQTAGFPLLNYREFITFICGILSQNNDIEEIFVCAYAKVVKDASYESLVQMIKELKELPGISNVNFTISMTAHIADLPDEVRELVVTE
jgi:hypothetical protein